MIDFVEHIVSKEDDQLLLDTGLNKLFLKEGPKKPKLESLSIPQWVTGAIRILNHVIEGNQFSSLGEMQCYLGYMVKVMKLAGGYEWVSVLKFDDDFRHIQAFYHYPWLYESHHLHATRLQPKSSTYATGANLQKAKSQQSQSQGQNRSNIVQVAQYAGDGREICRNYNRQRGCQLTSCNFAHVCNRKIGGKACGQGHTHFYHNFMLSLPKDKGKDGSN